MLDENYDPMSSFWIGARRLAFTATLWNINTHLSVRKMKEGSRPQV